MRYLDFSYCVPENYDIYLWGDLHIGNIGVNYKSITDFIHKVKGSKNARVILMGDQLETITVGDPRYQREAHGRLPTINLQMDELERILDPIADRIDAVLDGNHEDRMMDVFEITKTILRSRLKLDLEKHYGAYNCKVNYGAWQAYLWHGFGNSPMSMAGDHKQIKTNQEIYLKRRLRGKSADCFLMAMGHIHQAWIHEPDHALEIVHHNGKAKQIYTQPSKIPIDGGMYRIHEDDRWYVSTGTALKLMGDGFSTYAEKWGLNPNELGCIKATVKKGMLQTCEKVRL